MPAAIGETAITQPHALAAQRAAYARRAVLVIVLAAIFRSLIIPLFPPGPDECSYWDWSRHPDLSYVDHPPMVAYLIRASTLLFGDTVWGPRIFASILAATSAWLVFLSAARLFTPRAAFWSAALYSCSPIFGAAAGILLIPESILMVWITLGLFLSIHLIQRDNPRWFLALGVVLGLGLLTKLPAILIPAALGFFAICSSKHRVWFSRGEPYLMVAIAAAMFCPVIIWNMEHDWAGLAFLTRRTTASTGSPGFNGVWQSLAGQAAYHSPLVFLVLIAGVLASGFRGFFSRDSRFLLLFCFSGPVIAIFLVFCAYRETLPHWPAAGYVAAYIAAPAAFLVRRKQDAPDAPDRLATVSLAAAAISAAIISVMLPMVMVYPVKTVIYEKWANRFSALPDSPEPMAEAYGWKKEIRNALLDLREQVVEKTGQQPVVLTHYHLTAALLRRAMVSDDIEIISLHHDAYQYDIWFDDKDAMDRPVIFVSSDHSQYSGGDPGDYYAFAQCEVQPPVEIIRHDIKINEVRFWVCEGYEGPKDRPLDKSLQDGEKEQ